MPDGQVCLKCDFCGAEYRGKIADKHPQRGYSVMSSGQLIKDAREAGWTGDLTYESNNDRCPKCSAIQPSTVGDK